LYLLVLFVFHVFLCEKDRIFVYSVVLGVGFQAFSVLSNGLKRNGEKRLFGQLILCLTVSFAD